MRKVVMWSAAALILALGALSFTSLPVIGRRAKPAGAAANAGTDRRR